MEIKIVPSSPGTPGTIDDTALIQANLTRLQYGGGGILAVGTGSYFLSAQLVIPPNVRIVAESRAAQFCWTTDLGTGVPAVTFGAVTGGAESPIIENLTLIGPGASETAMDGFAPIACVDFHECYATGFRAGVVIRYDHNSFYRCRFQGNYYNVYFGDAPETTGNHQFIGCWMDGPQFASVAVAGDNIIDGGEFIGGHVGFGPYGFYKFDGPSGPSSKGLLSESRISELAFEAIGNGAILDEGTGTTNGQDSFMGVEIRNPGFSWDSAYRIATRPADWAVSVRVATTTRYFGGTYPFVCGAIGAFNATVLADWDLDVGPWWPQPNFFGGGDGATWCHNCGDAIVREGNKWIGRPRGFAGGFGGSIVQGMLTEYGTSYYEVRPYGTYTNQLSGIAMNDGPVSGASVVIVAYSGVVPALCEAGSVNGSPLYILPSSSHLTPVASGSPVATSEYYGGGGPGGALMPVRIHWP